MTPIHDLLTLKLAIRTIESVASIKGQLNVTMTTDLPPMLPAYAMMYALNPATRGSGLLIDSNTISTNTLARGIALSGQTGVTISNNLIVSTEEAGILCANGYGPDHKALQCTRPMDQCPI